MEHSDSPPDPSVQVAHGCGTAPDFDRLSSTRHVSVEPAYHTTPVSEQQDHQDVRSTTRHRTTPQRPQQRGYCATTRATTPDRRATQRDTTSCSPPPKGTAGNARGRPTSTPIRIPRSPGRRILSARLGRAWSIQQTVRLPTRPPPTGWCRASGRASRSTDVFVARLSRGAATPTASPVAPHGP